MATVCVIDDQAMLRDSLTQTLTAQEHQVHVFSDAQEALMQIRQRPFDVILTDLRMPGMDGVELLREMRRLGLDVPVLLMTAHASIQTAVEAMKLGAFDYVQKPFESEEIGILIERAIRESRMVRENEVMKRTIEDLDLNRVLIGDAPAMRPVLDKIQRVAQSSSTVLITGESGTGKELIARAIHAASPRNHAAMLACNCAALSPTLLESELFGHEKGAFTGADRLRKGRFELANGGTLLLDEVSEIDTALQAKLLRVLQEREYERVGSSITRRIDVRMIATTNRDLREWSAKARFREDLYYRLSVLPIEVPPLRERTEDIPNLLEHFVQKNVTREGREAPKFTRDAIQMLCDYGWPGNVRELQNLCERVCVLEAGNDVGPSAIQPLLGGPIKTIETSERPVASYRDGQILADAERDLIMKTLKRFSGHRERTATALGIGLRTLGLKIKKWREEGTFEEISARSSTTNPAQPVAVETVTAPSMPEPVLS